MDEMLIRTLHVAGTLTFGGVASLLNLTVAQLDSFLQPLLKSNLLAITDDGLLALGTRGVAAMARASGEPPRLTRIEEATETFSVDLVDCRFCVFPNDRRPHFGAITTDPPAGQSRADVKAVVEQALLNDYFAHSEYLNEFGYRRAEPREIEYVVDVDEGRGRTVDLNVRCTLDENGTPRLEFPDLQTEQQRHARRNTLEKVRATFERLREACTAESRKLFRDLLEPLMPRRESSDRLDEYWGEESIHCLGRLESRDGVSALRLVNRFLSRLSLLKGDEKRSAEWLVVLASAGTDRSAGRDYAELVRTISNRIKSRSAQTKLILISGGDAALENFGALAKFVDAFVATSTPDIRLCGLDGIFVAGEFAYIAVADDLKAGSTVSAQRSVVTASPEYARDIATRIFGGPAFGQISTRQYIEQPAWDSLLEKLRERSKSGEARVLRLKPKS
jgi:hypothetical protein